MSTQKWLDRYDWIDSLSNIISTAIVLPFYAAMFLLLWNLLLPKYFGLPVLNFGDAVLFVLLFAVIFYIQKLSHETGLVKIEKK